jgi:5-methyltetrahydropteroyltriglutamate--homocysteine methyltransferase
MALPTEPIGSIPRPLKLLEAINACSDGTDPSLNPLFEEAIRDTIVQFEATGSPVITDGEQRKYPPPLGRLIHDAPWSAAGTGSF